MAATAEAQAITRSYQEKYNDLTAQSAVQQKTIGILNNIRDKVGGLEDDLTFSVTTFNKQIADIENEIQMERRHETGPPTPDNAWIDTLLNYLIIISLGVAVFMGCPQCRHIRTAS